MLAIVAGRRSAAGEVGVNVDFESFFRAEHPRLFRALFLLTGSAAEADDLAQEAMARVYERWGRVRAMESPAGYLYRTAFNLNRKRLRRLSRFRAPAARPVRDPADVAGDRARIRAILGSLPRAEREALVLVEWVGLDRSEAARLLGVRPGSLRVRLSRARARLAEMTEEEHA